MHVLPSRRSPITARKPWLETLSNFSKPKASRTLETAKRTALPRARSQQNPTTQTRKDRKSKSSTLLSSILGELTVNLWDHIGIIVPSKRLPNSTTKSRTLKLQPEIQSLQGLKTLYSTQRPRSTSFWGLPYRILYMNPEKELLWGLWVEARNLDHHSPHALKSKV